MDSLRYYNTVLAPYAQPFYAKITKERGIALWQEDGALYYTSHMTSAFRVKLMMDCIRWPAQSPDLNLIETL
jgi:hypothetical protein